MKRPMVSVALVYSGGLLLADYFQPPLSVLFAASIALAGLAVGWSAARSWFVWPLLFLCGWTNLVCQTAILSPYDLRHQRGSEPEIVTIRGSLPETPDQRSYVRHARNIARSMAILDIQFLRGQAGQWEPSHGRVLVLTPGTLSRAFFAGQTAEVTGVLARPEGPLAEGLFDYRTYLGRRGIYYQLKADSTNDWTLLSEARRAPTGDRFSAWAQAQMAKGLPVEDESLRLLWAMTLGWKAGLTNEIYEPFMRSGTMHIFAISGLHIALISGILVSLLRTVRVSRAWCGVVVVPLIWFYTWVTGWQPSAIRSAIMMTVVIGGWSLRRPSDILNSLATAGLLILLWDPQQLFGASFQLSFFCVLSMALLLPPLKRASARFLSSDPLLPKELVPVWRQRLHGPLNWLAMSVATSLSAWLGSMPLTASYFHLFSPVTLLANLVIVPLSSLALCCSVGSLLCGWCGWVGELFNYSAWFWMECMIRLSQWAEHIPSAYYYVKGPSLLEMCLFYTVLIGLMTGWLIAPRRRAWTAAGAGALALVYALHAWAVREPPQLSILPFDGGLGLYFQDGSRTDCLLVDPGTTNAVELGVAPYLRAQGVNRLPSMLLTHGDVRHVGGALLIAEWFAEPRVWVSPVRFRSPVYRRVLDYFSAGTRPLETLSRGSQLGPWKLLHPTDSDRFVRADDNALVLAGTLAGTRVLLLSDLGPTGQNALLEREPDLKADIVVTGLPSNGEPLIERFLDAVRPKLIIVADSDYPAAEHASARLKQRLSEAKIPVLYCRSTGSITIRFLADHWELSSAKGIRLRSKPEG